MTPLVTVTHYLSHPPSSNSESDLIVVMRVCCPGNPKISALHLQELCLFFLVVIILKSYTHSAEDRKKIIITVLNAAWRLLTI